ncbi:MAG: hypothetical protein AB8B56_06070 [Crocinitomicaceae bacterium]
MFRLILNRCRKKHFLLFRTRLNSTVLSNAKRRSAARSLKRKAYIVKNVQNFNVRLLVSLIFIFTLSLTHAQSIELSGGFNRLDYQAGVAYGHRWNHFHLTSKLEFGVTSTFAQRRIMPRVSIGSSYFLVRKGLFDFGPEVVYSYSRQKITLNGNTAHSWNEVYVGYKLQIGRMIKFVHSLNGGWINQSFYSTTLDQRVNFNSLGIYAQIGISYTL